MSRLVRVRLSKLRDIPSDLFISAILEGYWTKHMAYSSRPISCAAIWNHIAFQRPIPGGFRGMFEWDTRKRGRNVISTIAAVIRAGYVPGLTVDEHLVVRETSQNKGCIPTSMHPS